MNNASTAAPRESLAVRLARQRELHAAEHAAGIPALRRLLPIAQGDTGQSGVIAAFLLGCYNGARFRFDLTDLRRLDRELFEDCLLVLRMDHSAEKEVHRYFENGGDVFEALARDWNLPHREKTTP